MSYARLLFPTLTPIAPHIERRIDLWEFTQKEVVVFGPSRKNQATLSAAGKFGAFCEHCPSPDFSRSEKWSSCAAAEFAGGAVAFSGRPKDNDRIRGTIQQTAKINTRRKTHEQGFRSGYAAR